MRSSENQEEQTDESTSDNTQNSADDTRIQYE